MSKKTYYVVQPFDFPKRGNRLVPQPARVANSRDHADSLARRLATGGRAAIAFSRAGDPEYGEYDDAVLIGSYGVIPEELLETLLTA